MLGPCWRASLGHDADGRSLYRQLDNAEQSLSRWWKPRLPKLQELFHSLGLGENSFLPSSRSQDASAKHHGRSTMVDELSHEVTPSAPRL